jgi:hypothetical protein
VAQAHECGSPDQEWLKTSERLGNETEAARFLDTWLKNATTASPN